MSRQPKDKDQPPNQRARPIINGTTETPLAPPIRTDEETHPSTQQDQLVQSLADGLGQTPQQVRETIPLLRDPREYRISAIEGTVESRRVVVHVRPEAGQDAASSAPVALTVHGQQHEQPPRTEYVFTLTLTDDMKHVSRVDVVVNPEQP